MHVSTNYNRGSLWRKWDLQVQTRSDKNYKCLGVDTLSEDDLKTLIQVTGLTKQEITSQEKQLAPDKYAKLFVKYVTQFTDIEVIAITDHNNGDNIDSLMDEAAATQGKLIIFPGVEVSSTQNIHILCIFNPTTKWKATWKESIEHLLTEFGISGSGFSSSGDPLSSTKSAQEIMDITSKKGGVCIFAHIGSDNGLFKNTPTANGGTAHIDIYKHNLCQIVQIPCLGTLATGVSNIIDGKDAQYGKKYVTKIKCSDARKLSDIGKYFSWVKADPTFEGLKQIIYEPDARVSNSVTAPYLEHKKVFISAIKLTGSTNYILPDLELPLNRELVSIIGGRGSGKSALLDTIAFLNEDHMKMDRNGKKKIIEYYRDNDKHTDPYPTFMLNIILVDKDGETHSYSKELGDTNDFGVPFLYLGQEKLSSVATDDDELTKTVCDLIGIDTNELGQDTLISNAREIIGNVSNAEKTVLDIVQRYTSLGYSQSQDYNEWVKTYLSKLKEQQVRLSSKETHLVLEDINKKTQRGLKLKDLYEKTDQLLNDLKNLQVVDSINFYNDYLHTIYTDISPIAEIDRTKQLLALEDVKRKVKEEIQSLKTEIQEKKQVLLNQGIKEDVNTLLQASENLQRQINIIEKDRENFTSANARLKSLRLQRGRLLDKAKDLLQSVSDSIDSAFKIFTSSRNDSNEEEKELFNNTISGIAIEGDVVFDEKEFLQEVLGNFIDNRKIQTIEDLRKVFSGTNPDGSSREVTINILSDWFKNKMESEKIFNRYGFDGFCNYLLTKWPYFLKVRAIVKLNGKPTEVLSVGQRGTLLLKVYMATSSAKQILIIDQPEDNLDNNFIMHELVPLITHAKLSRQIIMSTHNANLVVNADSEQVVVALLDQNQPYFSGSIENPTINNYIKDILEGGKTAFLQREKKYQI